MRRPAHTQLHEDVYEAYLYNAKVSFQSFMFTASFAWGKKENVFTQQVSNHNATGNFIKVLSYISMRDAKTSMFNSRERVKIIARTSKIDKMLKFEL